MNRFFAVIVATGFLAQTCFAVDWPQWRGPNRDGISKETGLLKTWPEGGPKRVWLFENAGNGYSTFVVVGDRLFTTGTRDGFEIVLALDANTGKELWAAPIESVYDNDWGGGPRGCPTFDGNQVYALTGKGTLASINIADGKVLWKQTMSSLGGKIPRWGYAESVLVDGDHVICTPGGSKGTVAALDKKTGKLVWQSSEFTDGAHYASVVPAKINGVPQYVQRTEKSIVGIAAKDGKLLWKAEFPLGNVAVIPTPIVRDNLVYVTASYGAGCKQVKIGPNNEVETVYENKVMKNHHGGVILVGDHLYGHADPGWVCQNFKTGEEVWNHRQFGKGAVAYAEGMLYCQDEGSGTIVLVEASPAGWKEHGRFKLDPQTKIRSSKGRIWTHPVIANGKLYLRDQDLIFCFDVKKS